MQNFFRMSYFMPPIAPIRNEQGQTVTPATLTPFCEVSVEQVYQMITCNEKSQSTDRTGAQRRRYTNGENILAAIRDSVRHIHPPEQ